MQQKCKHAYVWSLPDFLSTLHFSERTKIQFGLCSINFIEIILIFLTQNLILQIEFEVDDVLEGAFVRAFEQRKRKQCKVTSSPCIL